MKTTRQIIIKDKSGYFFTDVTNINDFDPSLLNIDEISFRGDQLIIMILNMLKI